MTKFEEMCKAFSDNRSAWIQYRDRCVAYMGALIKGFAVYCEPPQGNLGLLPQGGKGLEDKTYALPGAMYFDSDGYWRADVCITVFEAMNVFPHHPLRFGLCLREVDGKILVKRGWMLRQERLISAIRVNAMIFTPVSLRGLWRYSPANRRIWRWMNRGIDHQ